MTAGQASLSITSSWSLPKLMSIESVMPPNHLILCRPLLLLPSIFPSIRVFSNKSALHIRWPKFWSFSFCISPSNEYPGLISFSIDWLDLLAVPGTLESPLQHHSSKASILWHSAFFIVQLSHPYLPPNIKHLTLRLGEVWEGGVICFTDSVFCWKAHWMFSRSIQLKDARLENYPNSFHLLTLESCPALLGQQFQHGLEIRLWVLRHTV